MLRDHLSGAIYRLLHLRGDVRVGLFGHGRPPNLQLLQGRGEQRIKSPMAVSLDRGRRGADFGCELPGFTGLCQLNIPLGGEDLVDTLVVPTANIPDELPNDDRILDSLCRQLPDLRRGTLNDPSCDRRPLTRLYRGPERLFFLRGD